MKMGTLPRAAAAIIFLLAAAAPVPAEERTVTGTIARLDVAEGFLTVRDGAGASWSYRVDPDAGIDLSGFRLGDRVRVTIGRATPLNRVAGADRLRKGDRVEKAAY